MEDEIAVEEWNRQTVMLMQAMLGAISPNFRMATIENEEGVWVLRFYIEEGCVEDIDEIDGIGFEFSVLHDSEFRFKQETVITKDQLTWPDSAVRVVYKRRESWLA
ncbi:hypothetical protein [Burkholderia aenigmatica]|uniref:Uncharacterized protein n=1 Tax=Burkholderia aenigmatica TaxID=2015348 RepID=A0A228III2_9BURK|nr:hypothetical protein [Burkholderia aenigmatica]OXI42012.1 hypothetical protein CFB84_22420 [Burkholderia aenigmatica]